MEDGRTKLEGLKQIASYCGWSSATTVRKYIERGLPVHSLKGQARPRYWAFEEEIDSWFAENEEFASRAASVGPADDSSSRGKPSLRLPTLSALGVAGVVILLSVVAVTFQMTQDDVPVPVPYPPAELDLKFQVREGGGVFVLDGTGKRLSFFDNVGIKAIVEGRLKSGEQMVVFVSQSSEKQIEESLTLRFVDPRTKADLRSAYRLPDMTSEFGNHSTQYSVLLEAIDTEHDGVSEIFVTYQHAVNYPSYTLVFEPELEVHRHAYSSNGHHSPVDVLDLDGDGELEILFEGPCNLLAWLRCVASVGFEPWDGSRSGRGAQAPDRVLGHDPYSKLEWFAVIPPSSCRDGECVRVDRDRKRIVFDRRPYVELDFDGFPADSLRLGAPQRQSARFEVWQELRGALQGIENGELQGVAARLEQAAELAERWDLEVLWALGTVTRARVLVLDSDPTAAAEAHRSVLERRPDLEPLFDFEMGSAHLLAENFERSAAFFKRAFTRSLASDWAGRPRMESLRGLAMLHTIRGTFEQGRDDISRFASTADPNWPEFLHGFLEWQLGGGEPAEPFSIPEWPSPDLQRYWWLEIRYARRGFSPSLLDQVDREIDFNSDARLLVRCLRAELLAQNGRPQEASNEIRECRRLVDQKALSDIVYKAHQPLVWERHDKWSLAE